MQNFVGKITVGPNDPEGYYDALVLFSGLSKSRIKKATAQGAARIERPGKDNINKSGLQLIAIGLTFNGPLGSGPINIQIAPDEVQ